ncbi:MAG: hypothetical protein LKE54_00185 [Prevotella sp.]|nr:hypothetical protein [Prevotella sp.]MCH3993485.1 hypothetical protein [Prevotella sp.]
MKKYLFILIFILSSGLSYAQNIPHLKFKGVPLTGSVESFVEKLESKGLTYKGKASGIIELSGDFASFKNCMVCVKAFEDSNQICQVSAILPPKETWGTIMDDYNTLKTLLTEKYGKPEVSETFSGSEPSSNFTKFFELLNDECNFSSTFHVEGGTIQLTMKKIDNKIASVILNYFDQSNIEIIKQKAIDDL